MLGQPEALVAQAFRVLREVARIVERVGGRSAFRDKGEIEYGEGRRIHRGLNLNIAARRVNGANRRAQSINGESRSAGAGADSVGLERR